MEALLRRKSFAEISVNELAARAGVSPATIYQRFSNVDATASVLLELYYEKVEEWANRPRAADDPAASSLAGSLRQIADDAFAQITELGHIIRPAYLYSRQHPSRAGPEWNRLQSIASAGFRRFLERHASEITVTDLDEASAFLACFFNLMLLGPLLHAEDDAWQSLRDPAIYAQSLATMAHRYLAFTTDAGA